MKTKAITLATICFALAGQVKAATINVPADYTSLQAAIAAAATGDEIVISANGPFNEFITIYGSMATNLTIRAATGFHPVIEGTNGMSFDGSAGPPPDGAIQSGVLVYIEHASTWIGIKMRINMTGLDDFFGAAGEKYHYKVGNTFGGSVNFTNCTFEWANDPNDPDALNSDMMRLEGTKVNFDHCHWGYVNMTPTNLSGLLSSAFGNGVGLAVDTDFVDCSWDISPDTSGSRRHAVGVLNTSPNTLHFLRCDFGDVSANDPSAAAEPRLGQAWCNLPHRATFFDQCIFGRGAGRTIATAIPGSQYVNICLFLPTRGNFTLNDPVTDTTTIPMFFTNCIFQTRPSKGSGTAINDFSGAGTGTGDFGRGNFTFVHCTYVDLDGAASVTNRAFMNVGDTVNSLIEIDNCIFSAPGVGSLGGGGILLNTSATIANPGNNIAGTITVRGTNLLLASSSYSITNDVIQHANGSAPVLADPLLQSDSIHLPSSSPAIDAGTDLAVPIDYDGNPRPIGVRPDIGAIEVQATEKLTITTSAGYVVISWTGGGTLQAAPEASGTYTNVPSASSPYTNAITANRTFYRTHQ